MLSAASKSSVVVRARLWVWLAAAWGAAACGCADVIVGEPIEIPPDDVCDGQGNCVDCNTASQCDADTNQCTAAVCVGHQCAQSPLSDGTSCDGGAGRCESGACVQSAPSLANPSNYYLEINDCVAAPGATTFWYTVNYSDPDGDVTPGGTRVFLTSRDDAGGGASTPVENTNFNVTGDGSGGTIVVEICLLFRNASWVAVTMVVWDAAENVSAPIETVINRPAGAN